MPQVPIYNQPTIKDLRVAHNFEQVQVNGDMMGENIARANYVLGRMTENIGENIQRQMDQLAKTKQVEAINKVDTEFIQPTLYSKDNGYFYKKGKNAAGQAPIVMQDYDNFTKKVVDESGLSGVYKTNLQNALLLKKNDIYAAVNRHDADETKNWQTSVYIDKENNILNQAIFDRNDDKLITKNLHQGYTVIELQGQLQNWDEETKKLKKAEFASKLHEGVIGALLSDGSPRAKLYYETHKTDIISEKQNTLLNAVTLNDRRYQARNIVNDLIAKGYTFEQASEEINKIGNYDLQNDVRSQYESKLREKDRIQTEQDRAKSQASWEKVTTTLQTDPENAYQAIDMTQSPEVIGAQMHYIEQVRKHGELKTNHQVYLMLREKSIYDAEAFKNIDLNQHKAELSESDFKMFKETQDKIGSMEYTIIQEDNKMIDEALKVIGGYGNTKKVINSMARALVNGFEKQHGRNINDSEFKSILDSLGYEGEDGVKTYKYIEQGMAQQVGFIKTIMNDFAYFEKVHKRQPDPKERSQIIHQRVAGILQKQNENAIDALQSGIHKTIPKPNETKELTYYADTYLPQLGKKIGTKFTIVPGGRYRPANGKYTSYHSSGEAVDVSMSEHSNHIKRNFFEEQLKNPDVKKMGTSDPYILAKYQNHPKIQDEREFDKKYGTNHVNHVHITLNVNKPVQNNRNTYTVGIYKVRDKG